MSATLCALLRGVNVNGVTIRMSELQSAFVDLGFTHVKTVLNTGNVVFSAAAPAPMPSLKAAAEAALSRRFAYDAHVFLRGADEIGDILKAAQNISVSDGCHLYVLFCEDSSIPEQLAVLFESVQRAPEERLIPRGREAFWIVPKGMTADSAFGSKVLGHKQYKSLLTSRNINTVQKIQSALEQIDSAECALSSCGVLHAPQ